MPEKEYRDRLADRIAAVRMAAQDCRRLFEYRHSDWGAAVGPSYTQRFVDAVHRWRTARSALLYECARYVKTIHCPVSGGHY